MTASAPAEDKPLPPAPRAEKIRVLVVTGGHDFEREPFLSLFAGHPDIEAVEVAHPEAVAWMTVMRADEYDVLVWYDMQTQSTMEIRKNLEELFDRGKPLLAMHHSIANYQDWPEALKIRGGRFWMPGTEGREPSTARHGVTFRIRVANPAHPITRFMRDFEIRDEIYGNMEFMPGIVPLLTTDLPESDAAVAWTHIYRKSPVVYIQPGHGPEAYEHPAYRRLVAQSIRWLAGKLPDPTDEGFVPLFNGKNLDGWTVMGNPEAFEVRNGILRSESGKDGHWIRTNRTYDDFILRVDWRISRNGNSGVFVRARADGYPWDTGYEIQISSDPRGPGHCTGALYGRVPVNPRPDETPEVWHQFEIHCLGPRIKVFADNIPIIDVDQRQVELARDVPLSGYIGLQDSHRPNGWVEFRNVMIRELKPGDRPTGGRP